jgi:hypothetical protein
MRAVQIFQTDPPHPSRGVNMRSQRRRSHPWIHDRVGAGLTPARRVHEFDLPLQSGRFGPVGPSLRTLRGLNSIPIRSPPHESRRTSRRFQFARVGANRVLGTYTLAAQQWPDYNAYQTRTGREIPWSCSSGVADRHQRPRPAPPHRAATGCRGSTKGRRSWVTPARDRRRTRSASGVSLRRRRRGEG